MRAPGLRRDHGSASTLGVVLVAALVLAALVSTAVGAVVVGQRRVESAADLAALAGAAALQQGAPACQAARSVARRNEARLVRCGRDGDLVVVEVGRDLRLGLGRLLPSALTVTGSARAGPVGRRR